jgi:hypothetical protein
VKGWVLEEIGFDARAKVPGAVAPVSEVEVYRERNPHKSKWPYRIDCFSFADTRKVRDDSAQATFTVHSIELKIAKLQPLYEATVGLGKLDGKKGPDVWPVLDEFREDLRAIRLQRWANELHLKFLKLVKGLTPDEAVKRIDQKLEAEDYAEVPWDKTNGVLQEGEKLSSGDQLYIHYEKDNGAVRLPVKAQVLRAFQQSILYRHCLLNGSIGSGSSRNVERREAADANSGHGVRALYVIVIGDEVIANEFEIFGNSRYTFHPPKRSKHSQ